MESPEAERKFVWPPRRIEGIGAASDGPAAASRKAEGPGAPTPPPAQVQSPSSWGALVRSVERTWLGLDVAPLYERTQDAGWTPDDLSAYCPRCGTTVGSYEASETGCAACRARRLPWERLVRLGPYTGLLREMVHEVKFTRWRRLGDELGQLLGESLREAIVAAGAREERVVLVPVPSSVWRRLGRGIDHATVIARGISRKTGYPMAAALRRKHRPSQLSVPAGRRTANVAGSFMARRGWDLAGRHVVVVDDVTTTRATLAAACRALSPICKSLSDNDLGRSITRMWCCVIGVTPHVGERPAGFVGGRDQR